MYTDGIILRQLIVAGLTTKGSELTADELDTNFKLIWQDLNARLSAGALPDYNPVKTYSLGNAVKYGGFSWVYVFATPTAGTEPGSDPDYWTSVNAEYFAHQQNTDTKLAEGTTDEVSASELRAFVDAGSTAANLGTADLVQTDPAREYDIDGGTLTFTNGKLFVNTSSLTGGLFQMEVASSSNGAFITASGTAVSASGPSAVIGAGSVKGVSGSTVSGVGVEGIATGSGKAGIFKGGAYIETYGVGGSAHTSAALEVKSTTQGLLPPVITTADKNAIPSPATGLSLFDSTMARPEYFNGSYWAGSKQIINIFHGSNWNPSNSQTVVFSGTTLVPQVAPYSGAMQLKLKGAGVIRACFLTNIATSVVGSNEAWSLYIRINSTDYLVATVTTNSSGVRVFENVALNIPYVDGDLLQMAFVNPPWATRPQGVISHGTLIME